MRRASDPSPSLRTSVGRRFVCFAAVATASAALWLVASPAAAAPKVLSKTAKQGLDLAKGGDCVAAVPVLEKAETEGHRPSTAAALAKCHIALGELLLAHEIYMELAREKASASWDAADRAAAASAKVTAADLDARIPKLLLTVDPREVTIAIKVAGATVREPRAPIRVPPDEKTEIVITADGYAKKTISVLLHEREQKPMRIELEKAAPERKGEGEGEGPGPEPKKPPPIDPVRKHWLGVRFRGLFVPNFVMNMVADGGTTTYWPGVGITYTARLGVVDIEPSITVTSYNLPETPFKPHGAPDTEWEILDSSLWGAAASIDILYRVAVTPSIDFRIGAGFGIGWAFVGDVRRWQAYPTGDDASDPSTYAKCSGPNNPAGTFRYCNQLDKDAERYGNPDATWGDGGLRPVVYPWLSLPQLGFSFRPASRVAIDIELAATLNGFLTGTALRFGL